MTDGVTLNPGSGGAVIATDELATLNGAAVSGVHAQRNKVGFGADAAYQDVDEAHPLPVIIAGAATAAAQATGNASLAAISGQLPATLGQKLMAASLPVVLASDQGALGITATSLPLPSGAASETTVAAINGKLGALGQKLMAGSAPVVIASDQSAIPISATALPLPTGAATEATLAAMSAKLPASLGQKAMAASMPVTLASDQSALGVTVGNFPATQAVSAASLPLPTGAATSAAQATGNTSLANLDADVGATTDAAALADGTGNYSLVAGVKRALLNWANLLARLPAALGQALMAGSFPVAIASDQSAVNVSPDNVLDNLTTTGSVTSATTVVSRSTAGFNGGAFHVTSAGTSCTITYERSNDGANWLGLSVREAASSNINPSTTTTTAGIYEFATSAAFVRARVSTYGSGTVAITLTQKRNAVPVQGLSLAANTSNIGNVTINAASNTIGNLVRATPFTDSTTALGASATFTGTGRSQTTGNYPWFAATVFADQAGTLFIEQSLDTGSTYQVISQQAVTASVAVQLAVRVTGQATSATLYRVRYVNGGTAQGTFRLSSAYHA